MIRYDEGPVQPTVLHGTKPVTLLQLINFVVSPLVFVLMAFMSYVIIRHRNWPPIKAKVPSLLVLPAFAGFVGWIGMALWTSVVPNYYCASGPVNGLGLGALCASIAARKYRYYAIFVKHKRDMWPSWKHATVMTVGSMWIVPVIWVTSDYYPERHLCIGNYPILPLFYLPVYFLLIVLSIYWTYRLRDVRQQFNEYRESMVSLAIALCVVGVFPVFNAMLDGSFGPAAVEDAGPLLMMQASVGSFVLFAHVAVPLVYHWFKGDEEFLYLYTYGMSTLPDPTILSADLEAQLYDATLLEEFRKYAGERYASELVDFYAAVLDREATPDYFERQAISMEIIERFIRPGADEEINISGSAKRQCLTNDINRLDCFDKVKEEVLRVLKSNFGASFIDSQRGQDMKDKLIREASEMELLRKSGLTDAKPATVDELINDPDARRRASGKLIRSKDSSRSIPDSVDQS